MVDCGIGTEEEEEEEEGVELVVSQHRVLLFCQYKSMLDIIESDLLKWVLCVLCECGVCM